MDEDTDCGNEILCTTIAIKNALICIDNEYTSRLKEVELISEYLPCDIYSQQVIFIQKEWNEVKQAIQKI